MDEKNHGGAGPAPEGRGPHEAPETAAGPDRQTPAAKERAKNLPQAPDPVVAQDDLDQAHPGQPGD